MVKFLEDKSKDLDLSYDKSFTGYYDGKLLSVEYFGVFPKASVDFNSGVITSFSDSFKSNWSETTAIGKMDNIASYSNTIRSISTGLMLIAESNKAAQRNMAQAAKLVSFTYPAYNGDGQMIRPFVKLKLMNLISDGAGGPLNGYLKEVSLDHDLQDAVFFDNAGNAYPKNITINLSFEVLHTDSLGYDQQDYKNGNEEFASFPYGIQERDPNVNPIAEDTVPVPTEDTGTSEKKGKEEQVGKGVQDGKGASDVLKGEGS